jgi:hypothetical protein
VNVCDYLEPRDVGQKQIDDSETKTAVARLINPIHPFCHKHDLVAVRLKHKPECVAYRRFVIDDQNTDFILCYSRHLLRFRRHRRDWTFNLDAQFLEFAIESRPRETQYLRGLLNIAVSAFESLHYRLALDLFHR